MVNQISDSPFEKYFADSQFLRVLPAGRQANVYLVANHETGAQSVLKIHNLRRTSLRQDVMGRILAAWKRASVLGERRVVRLFEFDEIEVRNANSTAYFWWESQEYVPGGDLGDFLARQRRGLSREQGIELVTELHKVVSFSQTIGGTKGRLVHRDIKPENIMLRGDPGKGETLELAVGDFGVARFATTEAGRQTMPAFAPLYDAPENSEPTASLSPAADWWAVGMIVAEAVLGRHPLADVNPHGISRRIAAEPIDLRGVHDRRFNLLLRGLLHRDSELRWGSSEVDQWMSNGFPRVAEDRYGATSGATRSDQPQREPFDFLNQEIRSLPELVEAMQWRWREATADYLDPAGEHYRKLWTWMADAADDTEAARTVRSDADPEVKLATLAVRHTDQAVFRPGSKDDVDSLLTHKNLVRVAEQIRSEPHNRVDVPPPPDPPPPKPAIPDGAELLQPTADFDTSADDDGGAHGEFEISTDDEVQAGSEETRPETREERWIEGLYEHQILGIWSQAQRADAEPLGRLGYEWKKSYEAFRDGLPEVWRERRSAAYYHATIVMALLLEDVGATLEDEAADAEQDPAALHQAWFRDLVAGDLRSEGSVARSLVLIETRKQAREETRAEDAKIGGLGGTIRSSLARASGGLMFGTTSEHVARVSQFDVQPTLAVRGEEILVKWRTTNADRVLLNGRDRPSRGRHRFLASETALVSLEVWSGGRRRVREILLEVDEPITGATITVDHQTVVDGRPVLVEWDIPGARQVELVGHGPVATTGSMNLYLSRSGVVHFAATNLAGTVPLTSPEVVVLPVSPVQAQSHLPPPVDIPFELPVVLLPNLEPITRPEVLSPATVKGEWIGSGLPSVQPPVLTEMPSVDILFDRTRMPLFASERPPATPSKVSLLRRVGRRVRSRP